MTLLLFLSLFLYVGSVYSCTGEVFEISSQVAGDPALYKADPKIFHHSAANSNKTSHGWSEFKQCDSRWHNQQLGTCENTICTTGSAMTAMAMILETKGANHNPSTLNKWLEKNEGYKYGCNIIWSKTDALGKTKFQGLEKSSEEGICSELKAGHGVIASVNNNKHWILLTACLGGGKFAVNDPGFSKNVYSIYEISRQAVFHSLYEQL